MTEEEILAIAQDQLEIACENLLNQKNKQSVSYKDAAWEVESCINALRSIETRKYLVKNEDLTGHTNSKTLENLVN